jgi:hypothetical protein
VEAEDRHTDQDERQRLRQGVGAAGDRAPAAEERARQPDQPPQDHLQADEGYRIKVESANGAHGKLQNKSVSEVNILL